MTSFHTLRKRAQRKKLPRGLHMFRQPLQMAQPHKRAWRAKGAMIF
jgi:hypothetical protein